MPICAAVDGTVTGATPTGCGGNMVVSLHDKGPQTRSFHVVRYAEGLHAGQHVGEGQTVSCVGVTGTCTTGPHLHYESIVNGEHVDPLSIPVDNSGEVLSGSELLAFEALRDRVDVGRALQQH
jgi:murein DD-endopeptidase MepM/ murein hydrolase activator NlpD